MEQTGVGTVARPPRLDEDFEIDEAEGHETQSEPRHEACKHHQRYANHQIHPKHWLATRVLAPRHLSPSPLSILLSPTATTPAILRCTIPFSRPFALPPAPQEE